MNAPKLYTDHMERAQEHIVGAQFSLLVAQAGAPDAATRGKLVNIAKVLDLISQEFAALMPPKT
jgi:hypothetical protein